MTEAAALEARRDAAFLRYGELAVHRNGAAVARSFFNPRLPRQAGEVVGLLGDLALGSAAETRAVLDAARAWLRDRGCTTVRGPVTRNTWYGFRAMVAGFENGPPYPGEPANGPELPAALTESGFLPFASYVTWVLETPEAQLDGTRRQVARAHAAGYRIRALDPNQRDAELRAIHHVVLNAFDEEMNYLFHPIDLEEFALVLGPGALAAATVWLAESAEGEVAGFFYTYPSRYGIVAKTLGVSRTHAGRGVAALLTAAVHEDAMRQGSIPVVHALMRADGGSLALSAHGTGSGAARLLRRYAVFGRAA